MSWSSLQQTRLAAEKDTLDSKLKNVSWFNPTSAGNTRVEWRIKTNNGKNYTLRIYIPRNFPNECPILVVCSPSTIKRKDGKPLIVANGKDHVYGTHEGFTEICHFVKEKWSNDNSLYQVLMKGPSGWKLMRFICALVRILRSIWLTCLCSCGEL